MRAIAEGALEASRIVHSVLGPSPIGAVFGAFLLRHKGVKLFTISSGANTGDGWEHVSVSLTFRTPTWEEMSWVKDLFWGPEEVVMQIHPRASSYVNNHPYCLHLWKPVPPNLPLPEPPEILVGIPGIDPKAGNGLELGPAGV